MSPFVRIIFNVHTVSTSHFREAFIVIGPSRELRPCTLEICVADYPDMAVQVEITSHQVCSYLIVPQQ